MEIKFRCKVRLKEADEAVEAVSAVMENMILEENVERAIEAALAEPGDFEYAIDTEVNWMIHDSLHFDHHIIITIINVTAIIQGGDYIPVI